MGNKKAQAIYYGIVIVGGIGGYGLGYFFHDKYFPPRYSKKMWDFLHKKENWESIYPEVNRKRVFPLSKKTRLSRHDLRSFPERLVRTIL